jgi:SAM-dependent methyltransferase
MSTTGTLAGLADLIGRAGTSDATDPETVKACCAAAYGVDLVGLFLGESYHPGGADLTRRLADLLALRPDDRVLDVAAGTGTSAVLLAAERGVEVVGLDLGRNQVARATARAKAAGLAGRVRFEMGDAERLAFDHGSFDAVICECALCTFPDKGTAAAELARVTRPGGRVGISDVWLEPARLDPDLAGLAGRVACLADARPILEVRGLVEEAGLRIDHVERHDDALAATIEQVEARLRALRLLDLPALRTLNLRRAIDLARRAGDIVRTGGAGYLLLCAARP